MWKQGERERVALHYYEGPSRPVGRSDWAAAALARWGTRDASGGASPVVVVVVGGPPLRLLPACRSGRGKRGGWWRCGGEGEAGRRERHALHAGWQGTTPHAYSRPASVLAPIALPLVRSRCAVLCCAGGRGWWRCWRPPPFVRPRWSPEIMPPRARPLLCKPVLLPHVKKETRNYRLELESQAAQRKCVVDLSSMLSCTMIDVSIQ
jgi:hypothetical protein